VLSLTYAQFELYEHHFCSKECYGQANAKTDEESMRTARAICAMCGEEFYANVYDVPVHGNRFCSQSCYGAWRAQNAHIGYSHARGGKRDDLDGLYVRSSWEANWARYLNWLKDQGEIEKWEYEPDTFWFDAIKRGNRSYTPDFKVRWADGTVEYHEVKGYMDRASRTKLNRMRKYYPNVMVKIIDKAAYYSVATDVRSFIPEWEMRNK